MGSDIGINLADPCLGEEEAVAAYEVVRSGWVRQGPIVEKFETEFAEYVGVKYAVAVSSGTAALHVALASLSLERDYEVILPSFTCVPPISMTLLSGGTPVLVDVENKTYNIDINSVRSAISKKTKVILPINYGGHPADLAHLEDIAKENQAYLINDAAESLGSSIGNKGIASFGDVSIFSFSPNKTITTGEGGMIGTNNEEIAEKARILRDYGQNRRFNYVDIGNNYHLTEIQAAIGRAQLNKIESIISKKRENAKLLAQLLSSFEEITPPVELDGYKHVYMLFSILFCGNRDKFSKLLTKEGVSNRVYFPPVHWSPLVKKYNFKFSSLSRTDYIGSSILSLPSSPLLSKDEIYYIAKTVEKCLRL